MSGLSGPYFEMLGLMVEETDTRKKFLEIVPWCELCEENRADVPDYPVPGGGLAQICSECRAEIVREVSRR